MLNCSVLFNLPEQLKSYNQIYIYGAGKIGKFIYSYLKDNNLSEKIKSFVVTEINSPSEGGVNSPYPLIAVDDLTLNDDDFILLAANEVARKEMLIKCKEHNFKNILEVELFQDSAFFENISPEEYPFMLKCWFKWKTGEDLDLDNPKTFNEKIQWLKLYDDNETRTKLTDKYLVRDYIKEKIGDKYLIPLLGVWDNANDIDFDKLPDKFALKCNHSSGWNIIVEDKNSLDIEKSRTKLNRWLNQKYTFKNGIEPQYENINPKVIAEEYIENTKGDLWDYKFWCFNGRVENIMFLSNRKTHLCKNNYDRNWNKMSFTSSKYPSSDQEVPKPKNLDKMIDLSETLSKGFPFVRIDLYDLNDEVIKFGEFTFTPYGGCYIWNPKEMNNYFGSLIKLPID